MTLRTALPVAIALVAVFAAIAISVVRAREDLDPAVDASFDSTLSTLAAQSVASEPLGCRKVSPSYYDCSARVAAGRRSAFVVVHYRLSLKGAGCWRTTTTRSPVPLPPNLARPRGCIAG